MDVGANTRQENRHLYVSGFQPTWTPIKPVTTQFAVGRNRTVQVVRRQFPLRPAATKTIHRSQGDTETRIVVNFETKRAISHIHYVGLSHVTAIEGLYITNLREDKISVSSSVEKEMARLRKEGKLDLCLSPIYAAPESCIKLSFLNARSLHKHINDVCADINFLSTYIKYFFRNKIQPF